MTIRSLTLTAIALYWIGVSCGIAAELALAPLTFFDPQGTSSLSGATPTGATATITDVTDGGGNGSRPRIISGFTPADMSQIGQSVEVSFNMVLNNPFLDDNRGDLHLSLFDSVAGSELLGLVHIGVNAGRVSVGDFLKFRIDSDITPGGLGVGGQSRGTQAHAPGGSIPSTPGVTLSAAGEVHGFRMRIERISAAEHSFSLNWTNSGGSSTYSFNSYNETTGIIDGTANVSPSDVWGGGTISQFDGFAILLHDDDPFNGDGDAGTVDSGSYTISNFSVTGTAIPQPPEIIDARVLAGEFVFTVINGEAGATARVLASSDVTLPLASWTPVSTNMFDGAGSFDATNVLSGGDPRRFYLISVP